MKICIFGAGAIGGYIGAHLARLPDIEVTCIARGANLDAIRRTGLMVEGPDESFAVPVSATDDTGSLGPQDYVFVTLKQQQLVGAADAIAPLLGPGTAVLPPTTGIPYWYGHGDPTFPAAKRALLDPQGEIARTIDPSRVIGCVYFVATTLIAPGVVHHDGIRARFPLGEPDGEKSPRTLRLAEAMERAGLRAPVVRDIRSWLWLKMISSLCWNPVATLTRGTMGAMLADERVMSTVRTMMEEAYAVAGAAGVSVAAPIDSLIKSVQAAPGHKMSMLEDFENGRPLEIGVLSDAIGIMRDITGVKTPTIDAVMSLANSLDRNINLSGHC